MWFDNALAFWFPEMATTPASETDLCTFSCELSGEGRTTITGVLREGEALDVHIKGVLGSSLNRRRRLSPHSTVTKGEVDTADSSSCSSRDVAGVGEEDGVLAVRPTYASLWVQRWTARWRFFSAVVSQHVIETSKHMPVDVGRYLY